MPLSLSYLCHIHTAVVFLFSYFFIMLVSLVNGEPPGARLKAQIVAFVSPKMCHLSWQQTSCTDTVIKNIKQGINFKITPNNNKKLCLNFVSTVFVNGWQWGHVLSSGVKKSSTKRTQNSYAKSTYLISPSTWKAVGIRAMDAPSLCSFEINLAKLFTFLGNGNLIDSHVVSDYNITLTSTCI